MSVMELMEPDGSKDYKVYILYSQKLDRYYVGYTNDLGRRISEHNRKKGKYTDNGIPWEIKYVERYPEKKKAEDREHFIKSRKSKSFIEDLIKGTS